MNSCKICDHATDEIFKKTVLKKYPAAYFQCRHCGFVQTSEPVWIEAAYDSAITSLDIGLLARNVQFVPEVSAIIDACFPGSDQLLDYAGGYGVFVRLMRDQGFNFFRQDPFCENLFAKYFDITDIGKERFDVVTAFEVFEHFVNPLVEIEKILKYSDHLIFSTVLTPPDNKGLEDWWYIAAETGQHVAFYSRYSLELIAKKFGKKYYGNGNNLHLFTPMDLSKQQTDYAFRNIRYRRYLGGLIKNKISFQIHRPSLLEKDFQYIKGIINS